MPEDVDYALIEKRDPNTPLWKINVKRLKITDKNKLETLFNKLAQIVAKESMF